MSKTGERGIRREISYINDVVIDDVVNEEGREIVGLRFFQGGSNLSNKTDFEVLNFFG